MRVSTAEFIVQFAALSDRAASEPITIISDGRDRLVLVSAHEYARLKDQDALAERAEGTSNDLLRSSDVPKDSPVPALWGAMQHTISFIGDDIAAPSGTTWDVEH